MIVFVPYDKGGVVSMGYHSARVHHQTLMKKLRERWSDFSDDVAVRTNQWTPKQERFVGLYYKDKHVGTMDRGWMDQWPAWDTKLGLKEVDIDYALRHDDISVIRNNSEGNAEITDQETARVIRKKVSSIGRVGWAEVFWKLIQLNVSGLDATWLSETFNVPMDWMNTIPHSPLNFSLKAAKDEGYT